MKKIPVFTIFGLPGSGKSVQVFHIKKRFGYQHLSTGELVREVAREKTKQAKRLRKISQQGKLVDDRLMKNLVIERLAEMKIQKGLVFDNYPVNEAQMNFWQKEIRDRFNFRSLWGIYLEVDPQAILERLTKRRYCPQCQRNFKPDQSGYQDQRCPQCLVRLAVREDDRPEVIRQRIERYREPIAYLNRYFRERDRLIKVDGDQPIEKVFKGIEERVKEIDD